jgi:ketopantoate reductase
MLQDLEAGRPMELEALVGAAVELGDPNWSLDVLYASRVRLHEAVGRAC